MADKTYSYTQEQIDSVMNIGYDFMKKLTSEIQNCTFPNAAIIDGMKAGKSPTEICNDAYDSIKDLEPYYDGYMLVNTYNSVQTPIHNAAMCMVGELKTKLDEMVSQQEEIVEDDPLDTNN